MLRFKDKAHMGFFMSFVLFALKWSIFKLRSSTSKMYFKMLNILVPHNTYRDDQMCRY